MGAIALESHGPWLTAARRHLHGQYQFGFGRRQNACANHQAGCSLRGAILEANAHSGDTIVFNIFEFCGSGGCVINLLSALPDISASMSISGPSTHAIQRSSSAATNFRVFNVTVATTGTVNISDFTIKQGSSSANGSDLQNATGTLNVINCVFQGNVADNGGGISCNGLVNVSNCTFTGNIANNGGGIYNERRHAQCRRLHLYRKYRW